MLSFFFKLIFLKELKVKGFHAKIRCNLNDISYLSETQKKKLSILILTTSFVILIAKCFFNYVFLKITFPVINNVSRI